MDPLDLALAAKRVRQPIETIADNAINPLNTSCGEDFRKLIGHRVHGVLGSSTTSAVLSGSNAGRPVVRPLHRERFVNIVPICR
jgi:hypothetical protein